MDGFLHAGTVDSGRGLTLTVLGCGTLGVAILSGIFASLRESQDHAVPSSGTATPVDEAPLRIPSHFIACVRRSASVKRVHEALDSYDADLTILQDENLKGVRASDIVILACKPQMVNEILDGSEMLDALKGKLLISILAGVTEPQIEEMLYGSHDKYLALPDSEKCRIVRAMPNTAAIIRESMTVIATSNPPLPPQLEALVRWIFLRIGRVVRLPSSTLDVSTALCGSGPAFIALVLEALADGAVAMGMPRAEAQLMAAQTMKGTAGMVLNGEHPALVREKVSTPGGCTIGGLLVLEEGRVRGTMARSVREATVVASQLGKGIQGVNGTRF